MMPSLEISVAGLCLKHPVMNASGVLGNTPEGVANLIKLGFSAVVTKSITPKPLEEFKPPIIIELPTGGLINAVGLANPGKLAIKELVDSARLFNVPVIVSVAGSEPSEFVDVASEAERAGANAVELNLSCPNRKGYGLEFGTQPSAVYKVTKDVASVTGMPVIAKLGLNDRVAEAAGKALEAGARALTLINTVKALYIDVYTLKPVLTAVYGGLSGPPIHPIATRVIYEIYEEYRPEIIGVGGVCSWQTAAELIAAGAKAVQIGTALVKDQGIVDKVVNGLSHWATVHGVRSIEELVGVAHRF
jgi:dihydroorotate dehydrogenase (NAD+) catalytic subunit